jgi:hypothetical protein
MRPADELPLGAATASLIANRRAICQTANSDEKSARHIETGQILSEREIY